MIRKLSDMVQMPGGEVAKPYLVTLNEGAGKWMAFETEAAAIRYLESCGWAGEIEVIPGRMRYRHPDWKRLYDIQRKQYLAGFEERQKERMRPLNPDREARHE